MLGNNDHDELIYFPENIDEIPANIIMFGLRESTASGFPSEMVGRKDWQLLSFCFKNNFYRIPAIVIAGDKLPSCEIEIGVSRPQGGGRGIEEDIGRIRVRVSLFEENKKIEKGIHTVPKRRKMEIEAPEYVKVNIEKMEQGKYLARFDNLYVWKSSYGKPKFHLFFELILGDNIILSTLSSGRFGSQSTGK